MIRTAHIFEISDLFFNIFHAFRVRQIKLSHNLESLAHRRLFARIAALKLALQHPVQLLTMEEIRSLADEAMRVLPARVSHFASLVGVTYGRITIRNQKTRWGSCSSKGNLNFNCLLMLAPAAVQDYVVVHELCHRKEMNHSPRFWAEVERIIPEYKTYEKWLKTEGKHLMRRMTG